MGIYRRMHEQEAPVFSIIRTAYTINEFFLRKLGFEKNEALSGSDECVYRYYNAETPGNGLELFFLKEFSILSIVEFRIVPPGDEKYYTHPIVGEFRVSSDEDLKFIFSKNVRLNYIFNIANRRV